MAQFYGEIGFGDTVETTPGIAEDVIIERKFRGDVLRAYARSSGGDAVNPDPSLSNSISIVASKYAIANHRKMRYIRFEGELWTIDNVEIKRPRLILGLGDVYNGPLPAAPSVA
jgi:hypothetical protein